MVAGVCIQPTAHPAHCASTPDLSPPLAAAAADRDDDIVLQGE
jgi:hypothetical protein